MVKDTVVTSDCLSWNPGFPINLLCNLLLLLSHFSRVWLCATQSLGFSRQEHWSGLSFPSPMHKSEKWKWSCSVISDSLRPHGLQPTRLLHPWDIPGKSTGVGCHCLFQLCSLGPVNFSGPQFLLHNTGKIKQVPPKVALKIRWDESCKGEGTLS